MVGRKIIAGTILALPAYAYMALDRLATVHTLPGDLRGFWHDHMDSLSSIAWGMLVAGSGLLLWALWPHVEALVDRAVKRGIARIADAVTDDVLRAITPLETPAVAPPEPIDAFTKAETIDAIQANTAGLKKRLDQLVSFEIARAREKIVGAHRAEVEQIVARLEVADRTLPEGIFHCEKSMNRLRIAVTGEGLIGDQELAAQLDAAASAIKSDATYLNDHRGWHMTRAKLAVYEKLLRDLRAREVHPTQIYAALKEG